MRTIAIIPSGGEGKRFGGGIPKQYLKVNGREILAYTLDVFNSSSLIDEIVIAANETYFPLIEDIIADCKIIKEVKIVKGGKERQDSVFNALSSLSCNPEDLIVVHDAVRPLIPLSLLEEAINSAKVFDNIVVGIRAKDTLISFDTAENLYVDNYVNREKVFYAQTPQIFPFSLLFESMKSAQIEGFLGTDESMLVKRAGAKVKIVEGSPFNFKITTEEDLAIFDSIVRFSKSRH